jgi:tRNA splicing ligase
MIEVFKTNVTSLVDADKILNEIRKANPQYLPNFDLQDQDRILRVVSSIDTIDQHTIIGVVRKYGFDAEVLTDELISSPGTLSLNPN